MILVDLHKINMTDNNKQALIVAYYLSRYDKEAYTYLGYASFSEAVKTIGKILDVKPNTVKNMRDEFDPYHDNRRIGWQRELRGSRMKVLKAFQETDQGTLAEIVSGILFDKNFKETDACVDINNIFSDKDNNAVDKLPIFNLRGPTGKKAEMLFMEYFKKTQLPVEGSLIDKRDYGCGYDFEINKGENCYFIEVKGLVAGDGGVLFTNKEWQTALKHGNNYYLVLIRNVSSLPDIKIIRNPASVLKAKKNIYTTMQVNWSVSEKNLS